MIVSDASALVDLLLDRPGAARSLDAIGEHRSIDVPHLAETETVSALRRWVARGELSRARAGEALADLAALPLVCHAHAPLTPRVWSLRDELSAYDVTYLALAEVLGATLVTADQGLAQVAAKHVEVISAG